MRSIYSNPKGHRSGVTLCVSARPGVVFVLMRPPRRRIRESELVFSIYLSVV